MKRIILILFLFLSVNISAFADIYYKVYNPKENKSYTCTLGTVGITDRQYLFCFFKGREPYCFLGGRYNTKNGLIGGNATEYNALIKCIKTGNMSNLENYQYSWRELEPKTFDNDIQTIIQERKSQGLYQYGSK